MPDEIFTLLLGGGIALLFIWAFRTLPQEDWQVLACIPRRREAGGWWSGTNFTYYGFFNALAYLFAVSMFLIMMGATHISVFSALTVIMSVLALCMPASGIIARLVEKKKHVFSVGGAAFIGILTGPWIIIIFNQLAAYLSLSPPPLLETMAAMMIAYAVGEGTGRIACISFGCCYGKPLRECPPVINKIFRHRHFVFRGKTKKISYAHGLDGQPVVPVQAITAIINTGTGILCFYLFLKGFSAAAVIITIVVTQLWRFVSEFLRADYRGGKIISAYQVMSLAAVIYAVPVAVLASARKNELPELAAGIKSLWDPGVILFLLILGIVAFIYTGKSSVISSSINIRIRE